jgi:hypothetical protein
MTDDTPLVTQVELDAWANYHPIEVFRVMPEMQLTVELRHAFISGHRAASQSSAERIASLEARVAELEAGQRPDDAVVEALGDGHAEKQKEYRDGGYKHNALFADFADPGEVGFDAGWEACKRKLRALNADASTPPQKDKGRDS